MRAFLVLFTLFITVPAMAQNGVPDMPAPIRNLADEGAQIRYLGRDHGFDSWLTVKNGQEQYFYVPPGGTGFVMGVLFDNKGRAVTVDQVTRLRDEGDNLLDSLTEIESYTPAGSDKSRFEFQTPAERLFHDIETSNWVTLGYNDAPVVYAIILYMMATASFKMITLVPNNILRWLGQSVGAFNDSAEDPAAGLTQYAAMGGARIGGQLGQAATQGAGAIGQGGKSLADALKGEGGTPTAAG